MINPVEVQVWWPLVVALLVLAFAIGIAVGRVTRRSLDSWMPSEVSSPGRTSAPPTQEPPKGLKTLSGPLLDPPVQLLGADGIGWAGVPIERCGRLIRTNLGHVRCPGAPGHDGEC